MDIRQLRYFVAIAETGQITAAAKRLNIAQPPLSHQLKIIERELGVTLVERGKKSVTLTVEGVSLYQRAVDLLKIFDNMVVEVRELKGGVHGVLHIGTTLYSAPFLLGHLIYFRKMYPHLKYKVWEGEPDRLQELLDSRSIEVALTNVPVRISHAYIHPLQPDPFVFVTTRAVADKYPDLIHMKSIVKEPLILMGPVYGTGIYNRIVDELHRFSDTPNIVCESQDSTMLFRLLHSGFGSAIMPKSALSLVPNHNLVHLSIEGTSLAYEPAVVYKVGTHLSNAAKMFITRLSASATT